MKHCFFLYFSGMLGFGGMSVIMDAEHGHWDCACLSLAITTTALAALLLLRRDRAACPHRAVLILERYENWQACKGGIVSTVKCRCAKCRRVMLVPLVRVKP